MSDLFAAITTKLKDESKKIVFPEALDERILTAASQLSAAGIITPVLIGKEADIQQQAQLTDVDISACDIIDPSVFGEYEQMVAQFVERSEEHTSELQSRGHLVCRLL